MIRVCPVEDEKFTNVPDMLVVPETVVPVPVLNRTFCSPGCGLLPGRNTTDAEAAELANRALSKDHNSPENLTVLCFARLAFLAQRLGQRERARDK